MSSADLAMTIHKAIELAVAKGVAGKTASPQIREVELRLWEAIEAEIQERLAEVSIPVDPDAVEIARITITKTLEPTGAVAVQTHYSDNLALVDVLGMLAFSQWTTPRTYMDEE